MTKINPNQEPHSGRPVPRNVDMTRPALAAIEKASSIGDDAIANLGESMMRALSRKEQGLRKKDYKVVKRDRPNSEDRKAGDVWRRAVSHLSLFSRKNPH